VAVALCALVAADAQHHLLVKKDITTRPVAAGRLMTIEIKLFNLDEDAVYDIKVNDNAWSPEEFELQEGNTTSATFEKLAGGANVTHSYTLKPLKTGYIETTSAVVTYKTTPNGEAKVGYSSTAGVLRIFHEYEIPKKLGAHLTEWTTFLALAAGSLVIPGAIYANINLNYQNGLPKNTKTKAQ
jgi:hypothetical protein